MDRTSKNVEGCMTPLLQSGPGEPDIFCVLQYCFIYTDWNKCMYVCVRVKAMLS